jgi:hypothetical protein
MARLHRCDRSTLLKVIGDDDPRYLRIPVGRRVPKFASCGARHSSPPKCDGVTVQASLC